MTRHVLSTNDLSDEEIACLTGPASAVPRNALSGKLMAMLFWSPSTRTRFSYVRACGILGMDCVVASGEDLRLSDGEGISDTARAISTYSDIIGVRVHGRAIDFEYPRGSEIVKEFAANSSVPVINLECDCYHPNQALADLATLRRTFGDVRKRRIVLSWAYSPTALRVPAVPIELLILLTRSGMDVTLLHPPEFVIESRFIDLAKQNARENAGKFHLSSNRKEACEGADVIYARNWTSVDVGNDVEKELLLHSQYSNWTYTADWLGRVAPECFFMHCLPVDREHEVTSDVIDGSHSLVYEQMRQRVQVQTGLLSLLLNGHSPTNG